MWLQVSALTLIFLAGSSLSADAQAPAEPARQAIIDHKACRTAGHAPGTRDYQNCRTSLIQRRTVSRREVERVPRRAGNPMTSTFAPPPKPPEQCAFKAIGFGLQEWCDGEFRRTMYDTTSSVGSCSYLPIGGPFVNKMCNGTSRTITCVSGICH